MKLPLTVKLLFAEAMLVSAYVKTTLLFLPFSKVAAWLGDPVPVNALNTGPENPLLAAKVRAAVRLCSKYAPWPTECYTKALTAKVMLKRRKVASTLYFGFRRDKRKEMQGHAWLKSGDLYITGFCDFTSYEIHSCFS